jgi:hypothetical protein
MKIEVNLNPKAKNANLVRTQLQAEITELGSKSVQILQRTAEVESGALGVHEVYQFVIEHAGQSLSFATAVLSLIKAIIVRTNGKNETPTRKKSEKDEPSIIEVKVGDAVLRYPANDSQIKRYLSKVLAEPAGTKIDATKRSVKRPRTVSKGKGSAAKKK